MTDTSGDHARFGTLVHAVMETADRAAMAAGRSRPELDDALDALDGLWDSLADFGSPWLDELWKARAVETLETLFAKWPADSRETIDVERELSWEGGGARWIGRADRIERVADGSIRIVDYKTSRSIPSKKKAATSLQLAYYAIAADADPEVPGPIGGAEMWFPGATKVADMRRRLDMGELDELRSTLELTAASILAERWDPTPGDACERCTVRMCCPEWPEGKPAFDI